MPRSRTPVADGTMTDEELEALELGAPEPELAPEPEAEPEEELELEPIEPEPAPAPVARTAGPMDGWVPAEQHRRLEAQVERQDRMLQDVLGRLAPQPAAGAGTPTYTRPGDPADVAGWRGFVGETVDPVVEAKVRAALVPVQQQMFLYAEQQGEINARSTLPDYDEYAADISALRQEWYRTTGQIAPHVTAYHVARSMRQMATANGARRAPVKRVAAGASATVGRPAAPARPKVGAPKTLADVANMNFKQMEAALANTRL